MMWFRWPASAVFCRCCLFETLWRASPIKARQSQLALDCMALIEIHICPDSWVFGKSPECHIVFAWSRKLHRNPRNKWQKNTNIINNNNNKMWPHQWFPAAPYRSSCRERNLPSSHIGSAVLMETRCCMLNVCYCKLLSFIQPWLRGSYQSCSVEMMSAAWNMSLLNLLNKRMTLYDDVTQNTADIKRRQCNLVSNHRPPKKPIFYQTHVKQNVVNYFCCFYIVGLV